MTIWFMQGLLNINLDSLFALGLLGLIFVLALVFIFQIKKSHWIIYALLVWFPLENLILLYTPVNYYAYVKYFPELLLYAAAFLSWFYYMNREKKFFVKNPLNRWFIVYLLITTMSLILNWYSPSVWILGLRQLLRFVAVFFMVLFEGYNLATIKKLVIVGVVMIFLEAILGILQWALGGRLDQYLFFSETVTIGGITPEGLQEFWAPGQRVFATMGRYDRLGSFLALGIAMLFPWLYCLKNDKQKLLYWSGMIIAGAALLLSYSRANWIAAILSVVIIGYLVIKDKRVLQIVGAGVVIVAVFLTTTVMIGGFGSGTLDKASQSVTERTLEAFSLYSWKQSYEGYGRIFFIINTPLMVVSRYPLFGVGPGNYGGGVAAALGNDLTYDRLHLPFGIQNIYGQIDNNWWSIWGETGTLGLLCWFVIFIELIMTAYLVAQKTINRFKAAFAAGFVGVAVGIMVMAFFGPYLEFRTLMFYFWFMAGVVVYFAKQENVKFNWRFRKSK